MTLVTIMKPFLLSCVIFSRMVFNIFRSGFWYMIFIGIVASLLLFPVMCSARPVPATMVAAMLEGVSISCSAISDLQGNFVGATIPLKRAGRLLLLEGTIDNVSGNFILDTGASGLVLNKTYFRNSRAIDDEEGGGVTGSTAAVERINVKRLMVGELMYANIPADVTPLGHLENRRGVKILGLFGMSLLKNLELVIDIRNNELQLYKLDKNGNRLGTPSPVVKFDVTRKIVEFHNVIFVKASIGGKMLDFCLDTGAESNVLGTDAPKNALSKVTITGRSSLRGVGEDRGEVLFGTMDDFLIGSLQMRPMETIILSLAAMSQKYGYPIDGMLGYDFFAKGKIYINLVKKEMGICLKQEDKP
jgi:predicted aspartyl protease